MQGREFERGFLKNCSQPPPPTPPSASDMGDPLNRAMQGVSQLNQGSFCFFDPPLKGGHTLQPPKPSIVRALSAQSGEVFFFYPRKVPPRTPESPTHGLLAARSSPQNAPQQLEAAPKVRRLVPSPGKGRCRDLEIRKGDILKNILHQVSILSMCRSYQTIQGGGGGAVGDLTEGAEQPAGK